MKMDANAILQERGPDGLRAAFDAAAQTGSEDVVGEEMGADDPDGIRATPFVFRDPRSIPPRRWIYGRHLIRGFVSGTIAPGGIGKTSLTVVDALAMATGRNLIGEQPSAPLRVWVLNLEDPRDEIERRIVAAMVNYGIGAQEVEGRLFCDSGRDTPVILASENNGGIVVARPVVDQIKRTIRDRKIDVLSVDPFVASHAVSENDNMKIQAVVREWAQIADQTNIAIDLIHHSRKPSGQTEVTADDARGASAFMAALRSARVLNVMSPVEAEKAGIEGNRRLGFFRVDSGKSNLAPPPDHTSWRKLVSVDLCNGVDAYPGDHVGVVTSWVWPDMLVGLSAADLLKVQKEIDGKNYRQNSQATNWIGNAIGRMLNLNPGNPVDRQKITAALSLWLKSGALAVAQVPDVKGVFRPVIEVGLWAV